MENKEMEKPINKEVDDKKLDNVIGGTNEPAKTFVNDQIMDEIVLIIPAP